MVQNEVDKFSIDIHSKFDITLNHLMLYYHLSSRGGFIFSSVVFASCIVSIHAHSPIYCCTISTIEYHLISIAYDYVKYKFSLSLSLSL